MIWNFFRRLAVFSPSKAKLYGRTDTGRTRANNEDSFAVRPPINLMLVADGMGGHRAGEVASRLAVETVIRLLPPEAIREAGDSRETVRHLLIQTMKQMNVKVREAAEANPDWAGMGCTFVLGLVGRGFLYVSHIGDARAYLLSGAKLARLTEDHIHAGLGEGGVGRRVLSRAVGFPWPEDPDCLVVPIRAGDRVLLCSDGLWSMLPDHRLAAILGQAATVEAACDRLVIEANRAGGRDNITAVGGFL